MKLIVLKLFFGLLYILFNNSVNAQLNNHEIKDNHRLYDSLVSGMHIFPGSWRPVFKTEQIAWISPPWLNKGFIWGDFPKATDFIWLDFPKAIFSNKGLLFLSHINPSLPALYNYPQVIQKPWTPTPDGIHYSQYLPNGINFGGVVTKENEQIISLELWMKNESDSIIKDILLPTCAYLHPIEEFNAKSNENKFVHIPEKGWVALEKALLMKGNTGKYFVGWGRGSQKIADLPVIVTISREQTHLVAYTWWENTSALWGNPSHPSFNADPYVPDLLPGMKCNVKGSLIFFEGSLAQFEIYFKKKLGNR